MMERTPKSECTWKIEQDRSILKILTFGQHLHKSQLFRNWTFAQFLSLEWRNGSQNRNVLEKLSGTGPFWNFWLFGHGQRSAWSKHFSPLFFLFIIIIIIIIFLNFYFFRRFGPGQISGSVRVESGQTGQQWMTSSMTSQCWGACGTCGTCDTCGTCERWLS